MSTDSLSPGYAGCIPGNPCWRDDEFEEAYLETSRNRSLLGLDTITPSTPTVVPDVEKLFTENNENTITNNISGTGFPSVSSTNNATAGEYVVFFSYNNNDNNNNNGMGIWNVSDTNGSGRTGNLTLAGEEISLSGGAELTLIVFYTLTILFSVIGNILVVIVFTRGRRCRTDIRPFLINLAAADLIMALFCMPFTFTYVMTRTWIFSEPMCPLVLFMQHLSVAASVFTNMAIGIDRFLVVTFPLKARMTSRRARYTICVIWVCAVGLSSVQLVVGRARDSGGIVSCDEAWSSQSSRRTFTMLILFITYIVPLVILSVTYSIVSRLLWKRTAPGNAHEGRDLQQLRAKRKVRNYLWKRTAPGNAHEGRDLQQLRAKRKVIKMLVLVVIMFGVCWLPLHTFFLVLDFKPELIQANSLLSTVVFYIAFLLAMSNSCANPIIYGFTNDSFRMDLASLCTLWFPFCICLKRLASSKFSVSTYESQYNRRFSTVRKSPVDSVYRPRGGSGSGPKPPGGDLNNGDALGYRNGSKMYIELRRGLLARERSALSMNDFYRDSLERGVGKKGVHFSSNGNIQGTNNNHQIHHTNKVVDKLAGVKNCNGRAGIMKTSKSSNNIFREQQPRELKQLHQQQQYYTMKGRFGHAANGRKEASESGDSTKRLTPNRSHESDLGDLQLFSAQSQSPPTGSDVITQSPSSVEASPLASPDSMGLGEFLFSKPATNGTSAKLKSLPEKECSQELMEFNSF
ncbi:hypothetical protein EGW08_002809 [Elysia chlorotica]|uniref:G-protein coupled receptors family 1 profile domain-containing protein n=1 Tax=Elysia chlorotica TaxID=188477 RepID=A0A433U6G7_ELYCH|nr:hypothetical protein EGW08_002809 [Elysia chlorotica]